MAKQLVGSIYVHPETISTTHHAFLNKWQLDSFSEIQSGSLMSTNPTQCSVTKSVFFRRPLIHILCSFISKSSFHFYFEAILYGLSFFRVKGFEVCFLGNFCLLSVAFLVQIQSACTCLLIMAGASKYFVTLPLYGYSFFRVKGFKVCFLGNFGLLLVAFLVQSQSACSRLLIILGYVGMYF